MSGIPEKSAGRVQSRDLLLCANYQFLDYELSVSSAAASVRVGFSVR